jgi:hypothetical protein
VNGKLYFADSRSNAANIRSGAIYFQIASMQNRRRPIAIQKDVVPIATGLTDHNACEALELRAPCDPERREPDTISTDKMAQRLLR